MGAGGMWEEIVALGVPRLSPAARIRALEEAIMVVRALSGGDPVTFDGEFYHVTELTPAAAPTPPIWIGSLGLKALAVTGRHADGWIPGHLADWRSTQVAESRPIVDEAVASVGRNPTDVETIYNVSGRLTRDPVPETRDDVGRWIGGGVMQWVEELTFAVREHAAAAFIYLLPPGESISDTTTEPLGTRSRARCPRSNRQALTFGDRQASSIHRRSHVTIGVLPSEVDDDQYRRQASSVTARGSVSGARRRCESEAVGSYSRS
jgi:hypothetical protein